MAQELVVGYNPLPAAERVAHYQGLVRSRLIWLGVGVVLLLGLWFWLRDQLDVPQTIGLYVIGLAFSGIWLVIAVVLYIAARRALDRINATQGYAVRVDTQGIEVAGKRVAWPDVSAIATVRRPGGSARLVLRDSTGASVSVPITFLDTLPGTLDSAIRAYSRGTQWIDTSKLGN
ncbi:MAG TPA: hypothetical protein VFK68_03185 [Propionibacteriaceae bacterium]|nr:hypothetical protein [Propionibacteriaceae bacterium]